MPQADKAPTFEEVVALKRATTIPDDRIRPDTPYTAGPTEPYGDPGHVNPAINPAPKWVPVERPPPVPVVNDPGLLGFQPGLAELNAAARASYGVPETDATSGITEESHQEEIRKAAMSRLDSIQEDMEEAKKDAEANDKVNQKAAEVSANRDNRKRASSDKFGSASKA